MKGYKKKLGAWGEDLARKFLEEKDYHFVKSNWQIRGGELDLILKKDKDLVFVEVKTRTTNYGWAEDSVTKTKKQKISFAMKMFVEENQNYSSFFPRFDIVIVEMFSLKPNFIHYENVELR